MIASERSHVDIKYRGFDYLKQGSLGMAISWSCCLEKEYSFGKLWIGVGKAIMPFKKRKRTLNHL